MSQQLPSHARFSAKARKAEESQRSEMKQLQEVLLRDSGASEFSHFPVPRFTEFRLDACLQLQLTINYRSWKKECDFDHHRVAKTELM